MRKSDLSIGYEMCSKPGLGVQSCERVAASGVSLPAGYLDFVGEYWDPIKDYPLVGQRTAFYIHKLATNAMGIPGDFAEFGCFRGGTSFMLALMIQRAESSKKMYMHDNFDKGLPKPDRSVDKTYAEGTMACPLENIRKSIAKLGLIDQCIPQPGLFSETLGNYPDDQRFALVHLDCDLYHGAKEVLEFVYPRLSDGAPLIVDDYYDESHGVMAATNEFAESNGLVIHLSIPCQAYIVKGEQPDDTDAKKTDIDGNEVWITADAIRSDLLYMNFFELLLADQKDRVERLENYLGFCRGD